MFKIDKDKFLSDIRLILEDDTVKRIICYDYVTNIKLYNSEVLKCDSINYDNCCIVYLCRTIDNELMWNIPLPYDVRMISVEDKLKYNLPTDFLINNGYHNNISLYYRAVGDIICNLSIDIQLRILSFLVGSEVTLNE